uniref:Secreted Insect pheromone binding family protein n=1 Tax=Pristhesancus plagipennis TaxID=1955184 RepID=A0A2K8JLS3_PRIPG|nr:secreted Insect pheromone binding family protein [Pristhesancus plagipennis]
MTMAASVCFVLLAIFSVCYAATYTTKYDNIDLDEILTNERVYKKYFDCLTNKGKCTPDAKELKDKLPDALQTECSKCSEKQRHGSEKALKFLLENKPKDYLELENLYDKERKYRARYEKEAKEKGLKFPA